MKIPITLSIPVFNISLKASSSAVKIYRPFSFNLFKVTGMDFSRGGLGLEFEGTFNDWYALLPFVSTAGPLVAPSKPPPLPPATTAIGSCLKAS